MQDERVDTEATDLPPVAFSGSRLNWQDLPRHVRSRIAALAGAQVSSETSATSGFTPGFAAVLELGDGHEVFVKAVSAEQNPQAPDLARREIVVAGALPPEVPAPRLLWSHDDGTWVILGFDAVHGQSPEQPWRPADLDRVLVALADLAVARPLTPNGLLPVTDTMADDFRGWRRIACAPDGPRTHSAARFGERGVWVMAHLDQLADWESGWAVAAAGTALVHGDLRADNVMLDTDATWLVDWPLASLGAPWLDLAFMLPSVEMQGGGDADALFWAHPVAAGVEPHALRSVLAALAGHFTLASAQPAPIGVPNLRRFQQAQAVVALDWLRRLPA
ncbi:phosphotransferase family protein [Pengzhenrongella frigida]|uniref:phosphotransferase family protein n=1 Tax=Pengzhenrongella frigida TaxID=1259133 RepID=UPI001F5E2C5D|nr:phosphotransferase [Cellulomonas sp. HLT2-17]